MSWCQWTGWGKWNCTFTISIPWYRTIDKSILFQAVSQNAYLGSDTQRPHRAPGTNQRAEWKWLFHTFAQFQDSLHCILLEVWQHKSLALFRVWNWEQGGQRKKHQVPLWFSKWIADRMQCPWEEASGHGRRRVSQSDSLGQSDSDHTDCHSCSQKKNLSDFRVWIAPVSNSQAQTFVRLIPGGTVGDLPFLSS